MAIFITNYRQAWIDFRKSIEYANSIETLKKAGFNQRFANNILQSAFSAGWGNRKIFQIK
jgi:hypothetical protein